MHLVKSKSFYRNMLLIAVPIALQNLISFATGMMDTIMLGLAKNGETMLSAAALGGQPMFILYVFGFGMSGGATVLVAQYWGKRNMESIRRIFAMMIKFAAGISFVSAALSLSIPRQIMRLYSDNPEIVEMGSQYLFIMGFACITYGISTMLICLFRAVETVKVSVGINLISFALNVFLNWVLIFGNLGAPALGVRGAAIATVIARLSEFLVIVLYLFFFDKKLGFKLRDLGLFDKQLAKDLVHYGTPVLLNEGLWAIGISVQASIMGHIDYAKGDPVAANSIASMLQQLACLVIFGIANAAAVITGRTIGEDDHKKAREQATTFRLISYGIGAASFALIFFIRDPAVGFYNIDEATKVLARQMITVISVITFFVSIVGICLVGILRGGGDTRFCMFLEIGSLWFLSVPLGYLAAAVLRLPVPFVLAAMKLDEPTKAAACIFRVRGGKWLRSVTR
ncbi:MAG TPA: MATE family efflux transporter [Oscillospiraceae bacterium]|nr:MATE family efflux transporter [Oscillospiraceae bacterium]HPS35796.1 MATE family efflux transporter [Oscillospiraceae bacterium]